MSFLFATFDIPLWFLIFALGCAAPLWITWYKLFYKKFIVTGILERKLRKVKKAAEEKVDIFTKANNYWETSVYEKKVNDIADAEKSDNNPIQNTENQPYVKIVLKVLALKGDAGMLIQSIADNLKIKSNDIKSSLTYLEKNEFVEAVAGNYGTKYYLTQRGKNYCTKKGYINE